MEDIECKSWEEQLSYWSQKIINAQLKEDYWRIKIQQLKEGK